MLSSARGQPHRRQRESGVRDEGETLRCRPRRGFSGSLAGGQRKRLWGRRFPRGDGPESRLFLTQSPLWERQPRTLAAVHEGLLFPPPPPFCSLSPGHALEQQSQLSLSVCLPVKRRCVVRELAGCGPLPLRSGYPERGCVCVCVYMGRRVWGRTCVCMDRCVCAQFAGRLSLCIAVRKGAQSRAPTSHSPRHCPSHPGSGRVPLLPAAPHESSLPPWSEDRGWAVPRSTTLWLRFRPCGPSPPDHGLCCPTVGAAVPRRTERSAGSCSGRPSRGWSSGRGSRQSDTGTLRIGTLAL